jgi:hypothetical protein
LFPIALNAVPIHGVSFVLREKKVQRLN